MENGCYLELKRVKTLEIILLLTDVDIIVVQMYVVIGNTHKIARKLCGIIQDSTWSKILEQSDWLVLDITIDPRHLLKWLIFAMPLHAPLFSFIHSFTWFKKVIL